MGDLQNHTEPGYKEILSGAYEVQIFHIVLNHDFLNLQDN